ncbi:MAG TPA: hypothetical protein DHN29_03610 [Cytophagales bacterium]|nr:hypothetical protein [Cytophagales bacterium]
MAQTIQNGTQHANTVAVPPTMNDPSDHHGRMRIMYFSHDQDGAGDATSYVRLGKLPAGKVRLFMGMSRAYVNWTTSSATIDIGWEAYQDLTGTTVAADADGLITGISVDTVGYFSLEGASGSTGAPLKATGGTKSFESNSGVIIIASTTDVAIVDGDDLAGYLVYTID